MFIATPNTASHHIPVISTNSLELPFHLTKPEFIIYRDLVSLSHSTIVAFPALLSEASMCFFQH
jgi:hypothetical protein